MYFELSESLKNEGLEIVIHLIVSLQTGAKIDASIIDDYIDRMIEDIYHMFKECKKGTIQHLSVADEEHYPMAHAINVALYSLILAIELGYKGYDLREIGIGSLLHDLGKINTPEDLYWKQFGSTDYEKVTISEHPMFGSHMLSSGAMISDKVKRIIHEHHENYDGTGYPKGLSDADQIQEVKIVALCNYMDYQLSSYTGVGSLSAQQTILDIINKSGVSFHPRLIVQFLSFMSDHLLEEALYPKGTLVLLSTGEVATVIESNAKTDIKPDLFILTDKNQGKLERPLKIELKKDSSRSVIKILKQKE
jgi:putative nucleotidyltransferase with HDIG domain